MAKQKYTDGGALEYFLGKLREKFADKIETKTSLELIQTEIPNKSETRSVNGTLTPDTDGNITIVPEMIGALSVGDGLPVVSIEGETLILGLNNNTIRLINFTVYGEAYQAEEGMTWEQWIKSAYNPNGKFSAAGAGGTGDQTQYSSYIYMSGYAGYVCLSNSVLVTIYDTIEAIAYDLNFDVSGGK